MGDSANCGQRSRARPERNLDYQPDRHFNQPSVRLDPEPDARDSYSNPAGQHAAGFYNRPEHYSR